MRILLVLLLGLSVSGCLKTRTEMKETEQRQVMHQQVQTLQKTTADTSNRFAEIEEDIRNVNGRVEAIEGKLAMRGQETDKEKRTLSEQNAELQRRVNLLQESLTKMETQLNQLTADVAADRANLVAQQTQQQASKASEKAAETAKKSTYDIAQELFNQKEWKKAILQYEKYRQDNPKGRYFADATYKIGVSFQELNMKDEARTFYEEVISKFPASDDAKRSKSRLKGLRK